MSTRIYSIYLITNLVNGKKYVGFTSRNPPELRWKYHLWDAKKNRGHYLHRSIRKYGKESFSFEVLLQTDDHKNALLEETRLIKQLNTLTPNGYNLTLGGEGSVGWTPSITTRMKISEALKKLPPCSDELRKIRSINSSGKNNSMYGRHFSEESRKKMSESQSGSKHWCYGTHLSQDTKDKISRSNSGRVFSEETRRKMRGSALGKTLSEETKNKIGTAGRGRKLTDDTKHKMSEAKKSYWKSKTDRTVSEETRKKMSESRKAYCESIKTDKYYKKDSSDDH